MEAWEAISTSPYFDASVPSAYQNTKTRSEVEELVAKEKEKAEQTFIYDGFIALVKAFKKDLP